MLLAGWSGSALIGCFASDGLERFGLPQMSPQRGPQDSETCVVLLCQAVLAFQCSDGRTRTIDGASVVGRQLCLRPCALEFTGEGSAIEWVALVEAAVVGPGFLHDDGAVYGQV